MCENDVQISKTLEYVLHGYKFDMNILVASSMCWFPFKNMNQQFNMVETTVGGLIRYFARRGRIPGRVPGV